MGDRCAIAILPLPAIRELGLVLFVLGQATVGWAQTALGRQFSHEVTIQEGHRLVSEGSTVTSDTPSTGIGLALAATGTVILLWRVRDEEALLRREFGRAREEYAERSWRLVPFVF